MSFVAMAAGVLGQQNAAPAFDPESDITWHSLFWAEGTDFVAQGYSDTDAVTTWPNETSETDLTPLSTSPLFVASSSALNNRPAVTFTSDAMSAAFGTAPADADKLSYVVVGKWDSLTSPSTTQTMVAGSGFAGSPKLYISNADTKFRIFANSAEQAGTATEDTNPHLFVVVISASDNDRLVLDGTTDIDAQAGSTTISPTTFYIGGYSSQPSSITVSLAAVYEGDFTTDGKFADFKSWVTSHYGITIA